MRATEPLFRLARVLLIHYADIYRQEMTMRLVKSMMFMMITTGVLGLALTLIAL
ncbi:MAG: hypothetical protein PVF63_07360 [Gammaproteobacteria bacterium]